MAVAERYSFTPPRYTAVSGLCLGLMPSHLCVDPFDGGPGNHFPPCSPRPETAHSHPLPQFLVNFCSRSPAPGSCPTWEQCTADHARHNHQAHRQHLEVAGQDGARFGVVQVPGRQRPLHDDLGAHEGSESQPHSGVPVAGLLPGEPQVVA